MYFTGAIADFSPMAEASPDAETHAAHHRRRLVVGAAKLLLALAILAYLFYRLNSEGVFQRLIDQPKNWDRLAAAQALVLVALSLNYVRWWVLVRALDLEFTLRDAFRLGTMGMLLNQVSPGSVGGDLFKAVFIAREQPAKRTEAVASVLIDRVVGLYAMLLVASAGYLWGGAGADFSPVVHGLARTVMAAALAGTAGIALLMTPAFTGPVVRGYAEKLPKVGGTFTRLIEAAGAYRSRRRYLFAGILLAGATHTLLVTSIWLIGQGLPVSAPALGATFVVVPMSLAAGAIPLTPSGLGTFEGTMEALYQAIGAPQGDGALVAVTYRVMTYVMAAVGAVYYVNARRTVAEVLHEAEDLADAEA